MEQLIHMTATYSNALLVAILPYVSDFAKKLDLPIAQPVTVDHVIRFNPIPYKGHLSGTLILTNHYWLSFDPGGFVEGFRSPDNWFFEQDPARNLSNYLGQTRMTTNEILAFAREKLLSLGYRPSVTHADTEPEISGPYNLDRGGHVPYCRITWKPIEDFDSDGYSEARIDINTLNKRVVGLHLFFARTNRVASPLKLNIEPELESDYQKRTGVKLFIRSNAPPRIPVTQTNRSPAIKPLDD
jgi:hypothetical protein